MNKKAIITALLTLIAMTGQGISEVNLDEREPRKG